MNRRAMVKRTIPIRIRWYEGDYWEMIPAAGNEGAKHYNKKQIEVFIEDELPEVLNILQNKANYRIGILSPFQYQLDLLKERLDALIDSAKIWNNAVSDKAVPGTITLAKLSPFKAQKAKYDRVYYMPVEDTGRNPWSQKKELINRAQLCAKKELCVITSSNWMPKELQIEFTGYYMDHSHMGENCFLRDLLKRTAKDQKNNPPDEKYGFKRASIISIFDKVPYYRAVLKAPDAADFPATDQPATGQPAIGQPAWKTGMSAPECCLENAILDCREIQEAFDIYREVPLKEVIGLNSEEKEIKTYIENGARFDFVLAKGKTIEAIIEVDGAYHRTDDGSEKRDFLKDRAVCLLGEDFRQKKYIRLATDGSTRNEIDRIKKALADDSVNRSEILLSDEYIKESSRNRMKQELIEYLNEKIRHACQVIREHIVDGIPDQALIDAIGRIDYSGNVDQDDFDYSNELVDAVYLVKYGNAYAFEYAVMYEILLSRWNGTEGNTFGVTSFGCGSLIDAWSLAYARTRVFSNEAPSLVYIGNDETSWPIKFTSEDGNIFSRIFARNNPRYPSAVRNPARGIRDFIQEGDFYPNYNTLFFPKILTELPHTDSSLPSATAPLCDFHNEETDELKNLIETIRAKAMEGRFNRKEIYICISHPRSKYQGFDADARMKTIAGEIVKAINYYDAYIVDDAVADSFRLSGSGRGLCELQEEGLLKCYEFQKSPATDSSGGSFYDNIEFLNEDFRVIPECKALREELRQMIDGQNYRPSYFTEGRCLLDFRFVTSTRQIVFQIIKLVRREQND